MELYNIYNIIGRAIIYLLCGVWLCYYFLFPLIGCCRDCRHLGGSVRSVGGGGVRRESVNSIDLLQQQHLSPLTSIEQNTRVLTLAEQIIAAIPDRIKVRDSIKSIPLSVFLFEMFKSLSSHLERNGRDGGRLESLHGIGDQQRRQRSAKYRRIHRLGQRCRRPAWINGRQRFDVRIQWSTVQVKKELVECVVLSVCRWLTDGL